MAEQRRERGDIGKQQSYSFSKNTVDFDDEILFLDVETMCSPNSINMPTNRAHQFNESFGLFERTQYLCGVRVCSDSVYTQFSIMSKTVLNCSEMFRIQISVSSVSLPKQLNAINVDALNQRRRRRQRQQQC